MILTPFPRTNINSSKQFEKLYKFTDEIDEYNAALETMALNSPNVVGTDPQKYKEANDSLIKIKNSYSELEELNNKTATNKNGLIEKFAGGTSIAMMGKTRSNIKDICKEYDKYSQTIASGNGDINDATKKQNALKTALGEANPELVAAMENTKAGASSYKAYRAEQVKTTISTIRQTVAQTALNMAVTMGVSALISVAVSALSSFADSLIVTREEATQSLEEIKTKFEEINSTLQENKKVVDECSEKYAKLSKGVDSFGNNVSLTNEEFEEYNSLTNQIAEQFPALVSGYTDTGNAILACKDNAALLNEEFEKQNKLAQDKLVINSNQAIEDYQKLYAKEDWNVGSVLLAALSLETSDYKSNMVTSSKSTIDMYKDLDSVFKDSTMSIEERTEALNTMFNTEYKGIGNDEIKLKALLKNAGIEVKAFSTFDEVIEQALEENNIGVLQSYYNTLSAEMQQAQNDILTQVIQPNLQYNVAYSINYNRLTDSQKQVASSILQNLDLNTLLESSDGDTSVMMSWINDEIINPIKNSESGVSQAFDELMNIDKIKNNQSYIDYLNQVDDLLTVIAENVGENAGKTIAENIRNGMNIPTKEDYTEEINSFIGEHIEHKTGKIRTGIDTDTNDGIYNTINYYDVNEQKVKENVQKELEKLSQNDYYTFAANVSPDFKFTDVNPEVIQQQIQKVISDAKIKEINIKGFKISDYSEDYEQIKETVDKYKSVYDSLMDGSIDKFDVVNQFPDLAPYINDVEKLKEALQNKAFMSSSSLVEELSLIKDQITNPETKANVQAYIDMLQNFIAGTTNPDKSVSEVMEVVSNVDKVVKNINSDLEDENKLSAETLQSIAGLSKELSVEVGKYLNGDITYQQLTNSVNQFYNKTKNENSQYIATISQDLIDYAKNTYAVDISNCATYAEAKKKILASINSSSVVGTDATGKELKVSNFYDEEKKQYTDLYVSYQKSSDKFSRDVITSVDTYVNLIKTGLVYDSTILEQLNIDWEKILAEFTDETNEAISKLQNKVNDLNHKKAMGLISSAEYAAEYSKYVDEALAEKDKGNLSEADQATADSMEETNYSNFQNLYQEEYSKEKQKLQNSYDDKIKVAKDYYNELISLNEEYYGKNGKINDIDGTTYEDNKRELLQLRKTIYSNELEQIKKNYSSGKISDISEVEKQIEALNNEWQKDIPELTEDYNQAVIDNTNYFVEIESNAIEKSLNKGEINNTKAAKEYRKIWQKYYKDKAGYATEDAEWEQKVLEATKSAIEEQANAIDEVINDNTELSDTKVKALEEANDKLEENYKEIEEAYDKQIEAIDKQIDELDEKNDKEEKFLEIKEAEEALENARRNRRLVYGAGGTQTYALDEEAIKEAEEKLKSLKEEDEKSQLEKQKEAIEKQKEAAETEKNEKVEANEKEIKSLQTALEELNAPLEALKDALISNTAAKYDVDPELISQILTTEDSIEALKKYNEKAKIAGDKQYTAEDLAALGINVDKIQESKTSAKEQNDNILSATSGTSKSKNKPSVMEVTKAISDILNEDTSPNPIFDKISKILGADKASALSKLMNSNSKTDNMLDLFNNINKKDKDNKWVIPEQKTQSSSVSIGDIIITNPVGDVATLANEIKRNLPSFELQQAMKNKS